MNVNSYNATTRIFNGTVESDESPLEKGVYHDPAQTTRVKLPVIPEGKLAQFNLNTNNWVLIDGINKTYYDSSGNEKIIKPGEVADPDLSETAPPVDFYKPKFDGENWIDEITADELIAINKSAIIAELDNSEKKVSNDPKYPNDVNIWKSKRAIWWQELVDIQSKSIDDLKIFSPTERPTWT